MCRYFKRGLCYLLFLLPYIGGCQLAGGGFLHYRPPDKIVCGAPWLMEVGYSNTPYDPKEKRGKITEIYKDVSVHIRDSSNSDFVAVPMVLEKAIPATSEIWFISTMKTIPCDSDITYVEYYIENMNNGVYERTQLYKVPVSKK
jgi:hypothetical protein